MTELNRWDANVIPGAMWAATFVTQTPDGQPRSDLTDKTVTLVVSTSSGDLARLVAGQSSSAGTLTVDADTAQIAIQIYGTTTTSWTADAGWALWLDDGQADAECLIYGTLTPKSGVVR